MKLVHPSIDIQIDFSINNCYNLVVENPCEFFNLTADLINQSNGAEGNFVLSNDSKILNIQKKCLIIYDYFNINFSSKKITNLINSNILSILKEEDFIEDFSKLNELFLKINQKLQDNLDYPLEFEDDFNYETFVKFSNYKINENPKLTDKIIDYINIYCKLADISTIVFINLNLFLEQTDIEAIIKQLNYMQLNILFVNAVEKLSLPQTEKIIIDKDLCVI